MTDILLTRGQRYMFGHESGSAVITDSTDGAEGRQIIRNRLLLSGSHDPHTMVGPTLEILQGESEGIRIQSSGSTSAGNSMIALLNQRNPAGDLGIQMTGTFGTGGTPNSYVMGMDVSEGSFKICEGVSNFDGNARAEIFKIDDARNTFINCERLTISASVYTVVSSSILAATGQILVGGLGTFGSHIQTLGTSANNFGGTINVTGDITVSDDLFVGDCAHIDACHVGAYTDTDPGDGFLAIDRNLEIRKNGSNAQRVAATGNEEFFEIYCSDPDSSGYSNNGQNAAWIRWSSNSDAYSLIGYDITTNRFRVLVYDGSDWEGFYVTEAGNIVANGSFTTSDVRLKENINTVEGALDTVKKLRGVTFNWNDQAGMKNAPSAGVIAQEVEEVIPEGIILTDHTIRTFDEDGNLEEGCPSVDNKKTADYSALTGYLIEAIKEQSAIVEKLTERVATLEKQLENK